jgi:hypothetical protein
MTFQKDTPLGPTWLDKKNLSQHQNVEKEVVPEPERRITSTIIWTAPESQGIPSPKKKLFSSRYSNNEHIFVRTS